MTTPTTNPTASTLERRLVRRVQALYSQLHVPTDGFSQDVLDKINRRERQVSGDDPTGILDRTAKLLANHGWSLTVAPMPDGVPQEAQGVSLPENQSVTIAPGMSPAQTAQTALHEVAHVMLGHVYNDWYSFAPNPFEVEAEAVSYVAAGLQGLNVSDEVVPYIAGWAVGSIKDALDPQRVIRAGQALSDELDSLR